MVFWPRAVRYFGQDEMARMCETMCGRFLMTHPDEAMARVFKAVPDNDLPEVPRYNICPTQPVAVVTAEEAAARRLRAMRWGFVQSWYKKPTDAR